jgi:hypothetical protein
LLCAGEAVITDAVAIHGGPMESYDFHGAEFMQVRKRYFGAIYM